MCWSRWTTSLALLGAAVACLGGSAGAQAQTVVPAHGELSRTGDSYDPRSCNLRLASQATPDGRACERQLEAVCYATGGQSTDDELAQWCSARPRSGTPPSPPWGCDFAELKERTSGPYDQCRDYWYLIKCEGKTPAVPDAPWCGDERERRFTSACSSGGEKDSRHDEPGDVLPTWCANEREVRRAEGLPTRKMPPPSSPDLFARLGMRSPLCDLEDLGAAGERNCRTSGIVAHQYPLGNYGLDNQVQFGPADLGRVFPSIAHWIIRMIWQILVFLLQGVMLLLEWAYSIDLFREGLDELRVALVDLHENVLGTPWTMAALAIAGSCAIWNGLIRLRTTETFAALAATVVMMIGALVLIYDPVSTIGNVARLSNQASFAMVSGLSTGNVRYPGQGYAGMHQKLWERLVEDPWCALQFGDSAGYCERQKGYWLAWETMDEPGRRRALWTWMGGGEADQLQKWRDFNFSEPNRGGGSIAEWEAQTRPKIERNDVGYKLQYEPGTLQRFTLLAIVIVSLLGAMFVLTWISVRLILAAINLVLLLLLAPVMLIAAALGEQGRRTFATWVKSLVATAMSKFVFSIILGITLFMAGLITGLEFAGGIFGTWVLMSAFWWGLFIRRRQILALITFDAEPETGQASMRFMAIPMGYRSAKDMINDVGRVAGMRFATRHATGALSRGTRAGLQGVRRERLARRQGTDAAINEDANQLLDGRAREALATRNERALSNAQAQLAPGEQFQRQLDRVNAQLASGQHARGSAQHGKLVGRKRALKAQLAKHRADTRAASATAARLGGSNGTEPSASELRDWREQRARDIASWTDSPDTWNADSNLEAAGIDPELYRRAVQTNSANVLNRMQGKSQAALRRDQELLARTSPDMRPDVRRQAVRERRANPAVSRRSLEYTEESRAQAGHERARDRVRSPR